MPKDFNKLTIAMPDFGDREQFLKTLGTVIVDEIVNMIDREEKPDGTPQRRNSPKYADAKRRLKGYTTPLKGISSYSPYLARRATFLRTYFAPDKLVIHLNRKREDIGIKLTDMGYWFMGITSQAELGVRERMRRYFKNKVLKMVKGNG